MTKFLICLLYKHGPLIITRCLVVIGWLHHSAPLHCDRWCVFWRVLAAMHHPSGCYKLVVDEVYPTNTHYVKRFGTLEKRYTMQSIDYHLLVSYNVSQCSSAHCSAAWNDTCFIKVQAAPWLRSVLMPDILYLHITLSVYCPFNFNRNEAIFISVCLNFYIQLSAFHSRKCFSGAVVCGQASISAL